MVAAGCGTTPPELRVPEIAAPSAYREAGAWIAARPADNLPRDAWWTLYRDPELDQLQQRLVANSPDLAAALARFDQANAIVDQARAAESPSIGGGLALQRLRQAELRPLRVLGPASPNEYGSYTLGMDVGYELDLWGRVRQNVTAGVESAKAAQADLESARLSLQAQLAESVLVLRALDRDRAILDEVVAAYAKALELVRVRVQGGIAPGMDASRAETQLESARSLSRQAAAQRALVEHSIAALVGESASTFSMPPRVVEHALPVVPPGVPSELLQRRPDVAAAQRRMAAANASVGVAQAAFFPTVNLAGSIGYQSSNFSRFIRAPNLFWAVGPAMFLSLFDGGRRDAEVARTRAVLEESAARYRGVALGAFQQVEDGLALLSNYGEAAASERRALAAAERTLQLATTRYREGASSYLDVVTAQTAALQARRNALDLDTRQRRASVQLVRALGGGWSAASGLREYPSRQTKKEAP